MNCKEKINSENIITKKGEDKLTLIYKIENNDGIYLFGQFFVDNNKNNCKLIIINKINIHFSF